MSSKTSSKGTSIPNKRRKRKRKTSSSSSSSSSSSAASGGRRRSSRRKRSDVDFVFDYVNHLDPSTSRRGGVSTWIEFMGSIPESMLRALPIEPQKNFACTINAAKTCWEVQHGVRHPTPVERFGGYTQTKAKGATLREQINRVWKGSNMHRKPRALSLAGSKLTVRELYEAVKEGPVYLGLVELGYPWANRALKDEYGPREPFIVPRFDPYNNPWEAQRRSGADGHAVCIVGCFHSRDKVVDVVKGGQPPRKSSDRFGNVFVTKCTSIPAGWNHKPWSKHIPAAASSSKPLPGNPSKMASSNSDHNGGSRGCRSWKKPRGTTTSAAAPTSSEDGRKREMNRLISDGDGRTFRRDEFCYALLPIDLLTKPIRSGSSHRRNIDDVFAVPLLQQTRSS